MGYNVVPPPPTGLFAPPTIDLSSSGLKEFQLPEFEGYRVNVNKSVIENSSNEIKKNTGSPIIEDWVSDCDEDESEVMGDPQVALKDTWIFDSGCSRHMTGNKSYLTDYQDYDGGFVAFAGSSKGGRITGKGKIKTGKLDFEDVYFVKELKFIKAIYGEDGALNSLSSLSKNSPWLDIILEGTVLRTNGINILDLIHKKVGNGLNTLFSEDLWLDDLALKHKFLRLYALDNYKRITVFKNINHASMVDTFRQPPRGGTEEEQFGFILSRMDGDVLSCKVNF
ncbi:hypothetical protein Tco_0189500 [Tanacetum coccineum]